MEEGSAPGQHIALIYLVRLSVMGLLNGNLKFRRFPLKNRLREGWQAKATKVESYEHEQLCAMGWAVLTG